MVDVVLKGGRSFRHLGKYLLEGARGKPRPANAIGEILYRNLPVARDPEHAFGIMAATFRDADALKELAGIGRGGRRGERPVYHFTLSWSREERVSEEQALAAVEEALLELKLEDRQAVGIVHRDTDHLHVHVVVNRVSAEDGRFAGTGRDRIKLSRWAKRWEQRTFKRTFCRRPDRDEDLRVARSTYNRAGKYPIRFRKQKCPVHDEHRREAWRRLLTRQRTDLIAAMESGGDVAELETKQKTERAKLGLELRRIEERPQPDDTNRVDPERATTGAKGEHDHTPDPADAAEAQAPDKPTRVNDLVELVQRPAESRAPNTASAPADEARQVPESVNAPAEEHNDRAANGAKSAPDPAAAATAQPTGKPVRVQKVSEATKRSRVPISEPASVPKVEGIEAAQSKQTNAATAEMTPARQAVRRRTAQQISEPAGPIGRTAKSVDQNPAPDGSGRSIDRRDGQDSRWASSVAPPQQTRRAADSQPSRSLAAPPRATEQRPAEDAKRSPDENTGGAVSIHDGPVAASATKKESDGAASTSDTASRVRNEDAAAAAAPIRAGRPGPAGSAGRRRAAPIAESTRARVVCGGKATGAGQTDATGPGVAPVRPGAQSRSPAQAVESAKPQPPPAKPVDTVLPDGAPGYVADVAHRPPSTSTSPKAAATTSGETRSDEFQPSEVCLRDYGREPERAVAAVAAVARIKIIRSTGRRSRKGIFPNVVHIATMPTSDAQHAYDLWVLAGSAPPLDELDEEQFPVAAGSVAACLSGALGTRKTFDTGRKQLQEWPPPPPGPLRDIIRQAVRWFVLRLRQLFERRNKKHRKLLAGLSGYAIGGTQDGLAGPPARRALPVTTARKHRGRTPANNAAGVETPAANGVDKSSAASHERDRTAVRTPPVADSARLTARSIGEDSVSGASRRTSDRRNPSSTSLPTTPTATPTPPMQSTDQGRPVREVQVPSLGQLLSDGDRLENAAGGTAKSGTSQATDSVRTARPEPSGRTATPVRGSSGGSVIRMIAHELQQKIEAVRRSRYGETPAVPSAIWRSVREAAGDDEDKTTVIDALIARAGNTGDGHERDRAEQEYLEHLPEVVQARKRPPKLEPERSSWSMSSWFGSSPEPPETTTPTPDLTAVVDEARQRHVPELLEIVSAVVSYWRERLEKSQTPSAETSRSYRDEPWRRGHEPAPGHDRNQPRSR